MNKPAEAFIACRVAGENRAALLSFLTKLREAFQAVGVEPYITELAPPQPDDGQKLLRAFDHIDGCGALVVIYTAGPASEGMSAEIGYAYSKVPIWIFAEQGTESKLFALADEVIWWANTAELLHKIGEMK